MTAAEQAHRRQELGAGIGVVARKARVQIHRTVHDRPGAAQVF
jgi:hypothetical protein